MRCVMCACESEIICNCLHSHTHTHTHTLTDPGCYDSELPLASLRVDGGMTVNNLLLQLQADLGITIGMSQLQRILM